jgi:FkbM family methyltransferase
MNTDAKTNSAAAVALAREPRGPLASPSPGVSQAFPFNSTPGSGNGNLEHLQGLPKFPRFWPQEFQRKWLYLWNQDGFRHSPLKTILRLISWRIKCLLRLSATIRLGNRDLQMFLPPEWGGIAKLAFTFRERYEPELPFLEQILSPGMTFVDAGACYGLYTLAASKIVGESGRVITFEPASRAFRVLRKNIALNSLANVLAYPLALTTNSGKALLYHHPNVGCDSLGRDHSFTETAEEVGTESLDNVLRKISVSHVDVIKMDVQGAEELVLRGAKEILTSSRPAVIFEVYPPGTVLLGLSPNGAWDFLGSLGYEFFLVDRQGTLRRELSLPADRNVVAVHKQALSIGKSALPLTPKQQELSCSGLVRHSSPLQELYGKWRYLLEHSGFRRAPVATLSRLLWRRLCSEFGIPAIVNLPAWDVRFYLPPKSHGAGTLMIYAVRELYEKELAHLRNFISPGMVVVDGGANYGIYSLAAARLVGPAGRVFSFEPGLESFSVLQKNIELNCLQNARLFRAALADKEGTASLYHSGRGPNSFSLAPPEHSSCSSEAVATLTLKKVLHQEKAERVGLIKLDVEGAEELALRGALPLIASSRPCVIFEINPRASQGLGLRPFGAWELLENAGYHFFSLLDGGDLRKLGTPPTGGNVIAIHDRHSP